jgi:hypothetical protein
MTIVFASGNVTLQVDPSSAGKVRAAFKAYATDGYPRGVTVPAVPTNSTSPVNCHVHFGQVAYIVDENATHHD